MIIGMRADLPALVWHSRRSFRGRREIAQPLHGMGTMAVERCLGDGPNVQAGRWWRLGLGSIRLTCVTAAARDWR
jgi:hypothetical protein